MRRGGSCSPRGVPVQEGEVPILPPWEKDNPSSSHNSPSQGYYGLGTPNTQQAEPTPAQHNQQCTRRTSQGVCAHTSQAQGLKTQTQNFCRTGAHWCTCVQQREIIFPVHKHIHRYTSLIHIATPGLMARVGVLSECAPRTRWGTGDKVGGRAGHVKGILPHSGTRNSPVQLSLWT